MKIHNSKDRQHDGEMKKDKRANNDLQNIAHKTKDGVTRTPLKTGVLRKCSSSCVTSGTRCVNLIYVINTMYEQL